MGVRSRYRYKVRAHEGCGAEKKCIIQYKQLKKKESDEYLEKGV